MSRYSCRKCGGPLRRIHRTFAQRFVYYGMFECAQCREQFGRHRRYMFHLGPAARCPRCGSPRLTKLQRPDRIDPMCRHVLSRLQRYFPKARLFHCRLCRIQFWDRRPLAEEVRAAEVKVQASPQGQKS